MLETYFKIFTSDALLGKILYWHLKCSIKTKSSQCHYVMTLWTFGFETMQVIWGSNYKLLWWDNKSYCICEELAIRRYSALCSLVRLFVSHIYNAYKLAVGSQSVCRSSGREFDPGWSHTFVEIDHELFSKIIILLLLIQEGLLLVISESMCTNDWWSFKSSLPGKVTV